MKTIFVNVQSMRRTKCGIDQCRIRANHWAFHNERQSERSIPHPDPLPDGEGENKRNTLSRIT